MEDLLARGMVFVQLDPRVEGVVLPAHLRGRPAVGLNLSLNFHLETFEVTDESITASLSFGGSRSLCVVPWSAIFSMGLTEDDRHLIFPESAPPEIRERMRSAVAAAETGAADATTDSEDDEPPTPPPPPRGRPQLRLVK